MGKKLIDSHLVGRCGQWWACSVPEFPENYMRTAGFGEIDAATAACVDILRSAAKPCGLGTP
jgi:hypothetical protein